MTKQFLEAAIKEASQQGKTLFLDVGATKWFEIKRVGVKYDADRPGHKVVFVYNPETGEEHDITPVSLILKRRNIV